MPVTVQDHMSTDPVSVEPETLLSQAVLVMHENNFRHLPVTVDGALLGIVSDRDIRSFLGEDDRIAYESHVGLERLNRFSVDEVMTRDPITVSSETSLADAVEMMVEGKLGALPVLAGDERGTLVGIISSLDMLDVLLDHLRSAG